jgi:multimeric flavodoxin WrbA
MTKPPVLYNPSYGCIESMATAAAEGFQDAGTDVTVKPVPGLVPDGTAMTA